MDGSTEVVGDAAPVVKIGDTLFLNTRLRPRLETPPPPRVTVMAGVRACEQLENPGGPRSARLHSLQVEASRFGHDRIDRISIMSNVIRSPYQAVSREMIIRLINAGYLQPALRQ